MLGYPTLSLVAACDLAGAGEARPLLVCMNGGHGEWFVQPFAADRRAAQPHRSMSPEMAVREYDQPLVIGNRAEQFVALRGSGEAIELLPDARRAAALADELLTRRIAPIYGRGPDAKLPGQ